MIGFIIGVRSRRYIAQTRQIHRSRWNVLALELPPARRRILIVICGFRNASSRIRSARTSHLYSDLLKISSIRSEPLRRSGQILLLGRSESLNGSLRSASAVLLLPDLSVALNGGDHMFAQRVDHRDADAMEPTGHLVRALVELPACVQNRSSPPRAWRSPSALVLPTGIPASVVGHASCSCP